MPAVQHRTLLILLSFVAFVSLGLPDGVLGVAWPFMREDFHLPISRVGWFLWFGVAGYLISSFSTGQLMRVLGVGKILLLSTVLVAASLAGYALLRRWELLLPAAMCVGLGSGAIDAAMNVFAASAFSARVVTWMHAFYGVGATLGPICMTAAVTAGLFADPPGWRWGYGTLAIVLSATAVGFALTLPMWRIAGGDGDHHPPSAGDDAPGDGAPGDEASGDRASGDQVSGTKLAGAGEALGHPIVRLHVLIYFLYTGIEVTMGVWLFSLLLESRQLSPSLCGAAVTTYWASLTAGRIIFGQAASRASPAAILKVATAVAPVAAGLLWIRGGTAMAFCAAALLGFALAPIYPMLISVTPERVGRRLSAQAIGFQVSAATVGVATLPSVAGLLARNVSLEAVPPFLLVATLMMWGLNAYAIRRAAGRTQTAQTGDEITNRKSEI